MRYLFSVLIIVLFFLAAITMFAYKDFRMAAFYLLSALINWVVIL